MLGKLFKLLTLQIWEIASELSIPNTLVLQLLFSITFCYPRGFMNF